MSIRFPLAFLLQNRFFGGGTNSLDIRMSNCLVTLVGVRISGSLPITKERHLGDFSGIIVGVGNTFSAGAC